MGKSGYNDEYTNTKLFGLFLTAFEKTISTALLILADGLGKCPTAKIRFANRLLIAPG